MPQKQPQWNVYGIFFVPDSATPLNNPQICLRLTQNAKLKEFGPALMIVPSPGSQFPTGQLGGVPVMKNDA